jgi:hypothetical protein
MSPDQSAVTSPPSSAFETVARTGSNVWTWIILWAIALAVRVPAALLLPNAEQDGYSYAETIAWLSANFSHLRFKDLFGFWLPLFQVTAATLNVWIDDPLLAGKILSSVCGAGSCVLVFAITKKLTQNLALACVTFALILCSPLHLLYSAACMTDVPHVCLVLASLWFVLDERWLGAAIFAALAESVRIEAWALVLLLPLLQFVRQRRVSPIVLGILLFPPVAWLVISYIATGDLFSYFSERARYHEQYLDFYPTRHGFAWADIKIDIDYFLLGANRTVSLSAIIAMGLLVLPAIRRPRRVNWLATVVTSYILALLGFLLCAYITKRQPVILPRYSLVFFALGLPLFAWLLQLLFDNLRGRLLAVCLAGLAVALSLADWQRQIPIVFKVLDDFRAHEQVSRKIASEFQESSDRNARCFSDDVAVRVLSGLPPARFVRSAIAPAAAWQNVGAFESYLREQNVAYLVFTRIEASLPAKFYPALGRTPQMDVSGFQFISFAPSSFGPDVWLYRSNNIEQSR